MLKNIQLLRAIAAILVVIHHFMLINRDHGKDGIANFFKISEIGACGVDLFFCISGLVMISSIARKSDFSAIEFLKNRFIRITPTYWIATTLLLIITAINYIRKDGIHGILVEELFSLRFLISSYTLIPVLHPHTHLLQPFLAQGWTLSYELYFYIILSVAAIIYNGNPIKTVAVGSILLVFSALIFSQFGNVSKIFFGNNIVLEFIFGMVVFNLTKKTKKFSLTCLIIGVSTIIATIFFSVEDRVLFWGIPSALIIYALVNLESHFRVPVLFEKIGDSSYSLYLTHGIFTYIYSGLISRGWFSESWMQNSAIVFGTFISILFSFIFFRFIENPTIKYLRIK
jgi:peptidoglycan/LPS O-acetylase OafA/YrhL